MKKLIFTLAATAFLMGAQVEQASAATIAPTDVDQISNGSLTGQKGHASMDYNAKENKVILKVISGGKKERALVTLTIGLKTYMKEVVTITNRPMEFVFDVERVPSGDYELKVKSNSVDAKFRIKR